jgi:ubiquinone/menaquinone biosynthesis C-methylase UbiE
LRTLAFRQIEGDRNLVCSRTEELAFTSNSFDAIVAGDVLQSVGDDVAALREVRRVLKEGGLLCVTAPAYSFLWGEDDEARGHQRRYTVSELRRKLTTCGFQIHRASYFVASAFLPLVVGRAAKDIFRKSITHHRHYPRPSRVANSAMTALLDGERHLMHYINLPFGTRVVCWALKPALVAETVSVPAGDRNWSQQPLAQGSG